MAEFFWFLLWFWVIVSIIVEPYTEWGRTLFGCLLVLVGVPVVVVLLIYLIYLLFMALAN